MKRAFFIKKICYTEFVYERLRHQYNLGILYVGFIGKDGISETIFLLVTNIYVNIPMVMKVKNNRLLVFDKNCTLTNK